MNLLAIETSCDETSMALIQITLNDTEYTVTVINHLTHSQIDIHRPYGGVFPKLAKREHQINLPIILEQIMENQEIPDYICVTNGPGLEPALWTGITFAQELGQKWNIPVVPVNHMEGHILSVLVPKVSHPELDSGSRIDPQNTRIPDQVRNDKQQKFTIPKNLFSFPALALLISGGHTELVLVRNIGDYELIGQTRDDAVGEAFDKVARILGLTYPGGPEIAKLAAQFKSTPKLGGVSQSDGVVFPRPMIHSHDYHFSFSGLKTAVLYHVQSLPTVTDADKITIAHEFQESVAEVITKKTYNAVRDFDVQTVIVGGGVSANTRIRESLQEKISEIIPKEHIHFPITSLTGDNALMIALAGYFKIQKNPGTQYRDITAEGNLSF